MEQVKEIHCDGTKFCLREKYFCDQDFAKIRYNGLSKLRLCETNMIILRIYFAPNSTHGLFFSVTTQASNLLYQVALHA